MQAIAELFADTSECGKVRPMTDEALARSGGEAASPATSLRRALAILGDPWTMLILKEAFNGTRRFAAFQRQLNIPRQTLSLRLAHLCSEQMLYKRYARPSHTSVEYAPTPKTLDLQDTMYSVWLWHTANRGQIDVLPFDIVHTTCGEVLSATYRCRHCREPVDTSSLTILDTDPPQLDEGPRARISRRNDKAIQAAFEGRTDQMLAASIVGDLAANEILFRLFRAPAHMMALSRELGLGMAVLRGRLDKLQALGLVDEHHQGRRSVWCTLPKAEGLFPLLLSITAWGDRWCNDGRPPPQKFVHACGHLVQARFNCVSCGGWVGRENVRIVARK